MKIENGNRELVLALTKDNASATDFVILAHNWFHAIDDIVDEEISKDEFQTANAALARRMKVVETFAAGIVVLSHPFYLQHLPALRMTVLQISQLYALSVKWEGADEAWKRQWAETQRRAGMELMIAVAMICGGWAHAQAMSEQILAAMLLEENAKSKTTS